jgi:NADH-quinone oxidoreductase subunit M
MMLLYLILILFSGGVLAAVAGKYGSVLPRIISLVALSIDLILLVLIWCGHSVTNDSQWWIDFVLPWIPSLGTSLHLSLDGLSVIMLMLTFILGIIAVVISWNEIREKTGFFHFNLLWILSGITGVFLSMDLFLFYLFWELMLVPMYFLIAIWGYERRIYASYKFFLYTQASGLLMLLSILALFFIHGRATGVYTFDYEQLIGTSMSSGISVLLMSGFLAAFLVKLPVVPFHNWLPDAHTYAPTAGNVISAGILLKTGAYGLLRFVLPLFPDASVLFAPFGMILGVVGILYGAKLAFAQTDLKRLIAYTSVSHMGFVMIGIFAFNQVAIHGVILQIIAHAISTGALFIIAGQLYERIGTRDLSQMGGLWKQVPVMGAMGMIFVMASLGLPGLGNFVAEFLVLLGVFKSSILFAVLACLGLVAATIYSLRIVQKVFLGQEMLPGKISDQSVREKIISALLVFLIVWLGLFPKMVMDTADPAIGKILAPVEHRITATQESTTLAP